MSDTEMWEIGKLSNWEKNPREISPKGLARLMKQIKALGQYKPLLVNTNPEIAPVGAIAGGNMRLKAMHKLKVEKVWVIPKFFKDEKEMIEISLSDNDRVGWYKEEGLVSLVSGTGIDLGDYAVDVKEPPSLDAVVKNYSQPGPGDDDAPPLPETPKSKRGDLYIMGDHRLLCGDSTSEDDVARLMNGELAALCFTDPPYNVDYKTRGKELAEGEMAGKIKNDNMTSEDYEALLLGAIMNVYRFSKPEMSLYWWFASVNISVNLKVWELAGFKMSQWILWVKNSMSLSRQDYHHCFEPCLFGWKKGETHFKNSNLMNLRDVFSDSKDNDAALKNWLSQVYVDEFDVWFQHRDSIAKYLHPTMKPVALSERAIKKHSNAGDIVLDLFAGSGSTCIGCEKLSRRCFMMELDPRYVSVILDRWSKFTGKDPIREDGEQWSRLK